VRAPGDPPESFEQAWNEIRDVEGWLSAQQARRLFERARAVPAPGRIVEIGSFHGRSTIILALAAPQGVELIAIDPHLGSDRGPREIDPQPETGIADVEAFRANLARAGVSERVRHVQRRSQDALVDVPGAVDLLYVDGAHRYAPALADLRDWGARVKTGGHMLVHDAFSSVGVTLALLRGVVGRRDWRWCGRTATLAEYQRSELAPAGRAGEVMRGTAQLPFFARNLLIKVFIVVGLRPLARALGHRDGPWPY
jgi:SAM-dependent methyltransferase